MHAHARKCPEGRLSCAFRAQSSSEASSGGFDKHSNTNYAVFFDSYVSLSVLFSFPALEP